MNLIDCLAKELLKFLRVSFLILEVNFKQKLSVIAFELN
jgi:hypothetical protein